MFKRHISLPPHDAGNIPVAKALLDSGVFRSLVALFAKCGGDKDAEPLRCSYASPYPLQCSTVCSIGYLNKTLT